MHRSSGPQDRTSSSSSCVTCRKLVIERLRITSVATISPLAYGDVPIRAVITRSILGGTQTNPERSILSKRVTTLRGHPFPPKASIAEPVVHNLFDRRLQRLQASLNLFEDFDD